MKFESSVTAVSWIPFEAVKGFLAVPFGMGLAHYDEPLPARLDDLDEWHRKDLFRECNELKGWIERVPGRGTTMAWPLPFRLTRCWPTLTPPCPPGTAVSRARRPLPGG